MNVSGRRFALMLTARVTLLMRNHSSSFRALWRRHGHAVNWCETTDSIALFHTKKTCRFYVSAAYWKFLWLTTLFTHIFIIINEFENAILYLSKSITSYFKLVQTLNGHPCINIWWQQFHIISVYSLLDLQPNHKPCLPLLINKIKDIHMPSFLSLFVRWCSCRILLARDVTWTWCGMFIDYDITAILILSHHICTRKLPVAIYLYDDYYDYRSSLK